MVFIASNFSTGSHTNWSVCWSVATLTKSKLYFRNYDASWRLASDICKNFLFSYFQEKSLFTFNFIPSYLIFLFGNKLFLTVNKSFQKYYLTNYCMNLLFYLNKTFKHVATLHKYILSMYVYIYIRLKSFENFLSLISIM